MPSSLRSEGNLLYPPHGREYEDCKQILKLSLNPTHKLNARQDFSQHSCQKTCPYGQSGIRRLSACIRCAPAFCQSSSIHNSLRSIKEIAVWRLSSFSPGKFCELRDFAYGKISAFFIQNFLLQNPKDSSWSMPLLSPQGKNDRLRYRHPEWTVSTPWPERFQLRWHLRLRLGNVSKLPFLSACT